MKATNHSEQAVKRRVRAARLLQAGKKPAEVATLVGAPRQTVYRWKAVLEGEGIEALRQMSKGGRPGLLGAAELVQLQIALMEGPVAHDFGTPLWTLKRVRVFVERRSVCGTAMYISGACSGKWGSPASGRNGVFWSATRGPSRNERSAPGRR